ncbi:hypothetical protein JO972_00930 [Verrucomicrobiaceae bacterium 5K15]|uniref:DUF4381 domain-containing protein n=1 Tax=Oceaniferula flava TaxID=2800421 RepID=A0AAE2VCP4_9BACT|nr:hypothetical protein [Oceaniferula flavus]MBK1853514.1 hypothetical protein [Oceaniferula flavus]MBM1134819.1 hypothetical protein [Oceaniferula flavus]
MPPIEDITPPGEFLPEPNTPWWLWALVGIGVLMILALVAWLIFKPNPAKTRANLLDDARASLHKLKEESPKLPPHVTATRISLIIRRYLEAAFKDPALFETNEEFTLRHDALNKLHPDSREPVTAHLSQLSQLKYAPVHSAEPVQLIEEAEELLANIEINVSPETT